jgi:thioredoxin 1
MNRYKELLYESKTYTENSKIDEILIKNKFNWFLDCEVENVRIEIFKNHLIFNSGVFFNGTWVYGVFRNGQWKSGTWQGGVWYNGTWYHGIYESGLIFGGRFLGGTIEGGEIRGGEFYNIEISKDVIRTDINIEKTQDEIQKIVPQKIVEKLNHIKSYGYYLNESVDDEEEDAWWNDKNKDPFGEEIENPEGLVLTIDDTNYKTYFNLTKKPLVLEFFAEWCGPSRMVKLITEKLAKGFKNDVIVGRVDVDINPEICRELNIKNIPTIIFIKNGVEVRKIIGAYPLEKLVDELLKCI